MHLAVVDGLNKAQQPWFDRGTKTKGYQRVSRVKQHARVTYDFFPFDYL